MPDLNVAEVDIDISKLNTKLVSESWSVDLQDYIIDLAWSPDASKLAAITVEGSVFLFNLQDKSDKINLIGQLTKERIHYLGDLMVQSSQQRDMMDSSRYGTAAMVNNCAHSRQVTHGLAKLLTALVAMF